MEEGASREAWQATVHHGAAESDRTETLRATQHIFMGTTYTWKYFTALLFAIFTF
jgi:hypothetical protein